MKLKLITTLFLTGLLTVGATTIKYVDNIKLLKNVSGSTGQLALVKFKDSVVKYIYDSNNGWTAMQDAIKAGAPLLKQGKYYKSCKEIKLNMPNATSGIYSVDPDGDGTKFDLTEVYCDMETDGGGWTLFAHTTYGQPGGDLFASKFGEYTPTTIDNGKTYSLGLPSIYDDTEMMVTINTPSYTFSKEYNYVFIFKYDKDFKSFNSMKDNYNKGFYTYHPKETTYTKSKYFYTRNANIYCYRYQQTNVFWSVKIFSRQLISYSSSDSQIHSGFTYNHNNIIPQRASSWWYVR